MKHVLDSSIVPPSALDIEETVLGAMLIDKSGLEEGLKLLNKDCFYSSKHALIFETIDQMHRKDMEVDLVTVCRQLEDQKKLDKAGGEILLIQLTQKVGSSANIENHSHILLQKYIRRQVIDIATKAIKNAYDQTFDVFDLLESPITEIEKISDFITKDVPSKTWLEAINELPKKVEFLTNNKGEITGMPTGLKVVDRHFSGWQPQDFIVLAGDSGIGKTSLAMTFMLAPAKQGHAVGMFSLEMGVEQLALRAVAVDTNFHINQLARKGFDKPEYFDQLFHDLNRIREYPIYIDDKPALTVREMRRKARDMKRKHNIKLLVVDFLQMFSGHKDMRINIGDAARACKNLAKELNIPVIALSQVTRSEVVKHRYKIPNKHHLKEASAIEEAADVIIMIYRPEFYGYTRTDNNDLYENLGIRLEDNSVLMVVKNRQGSGGNISTLFDGNKTKFVDDIETDEIETFM